MELYNAFKNRNSIHSGAFIWGEGGGGQWGVHIRKLRVPLTFHCYLDILMTINDECVLKCKSYGSNQDHILINCRASGKRN